MAPKLTGNMMLTNSAEPVQIISSPIDYQPAVRKQTQNINKSSQPQYKWEIVWRNVLAFAFLHVYGAYGVYLLITVCNWKTAVSTYLLIMFAAQGVTSGAHRLWAHRSYKAKLPLRMLLCFAQTMAFQNHIYEWVRDHRVHHKFTDTNADPHNATRGFFFSHMGWLLVRKHKDVFVKGKTIDLSDLEADPVVMFQKKYYLIMVPITCFIIPSLIPWYFWGENLLHSFYTAGVLRYIMSLHGTWLVNSAAHIWGTKPYDKNINPSENVFVAVLAFGEGWHNYHHVFPWDYKAAELGNYRMNLSTALIDFMSKIGWAYDMKTVSQDIINKRIKRTGDGTKKVDAGLEDHHHDDSEPIWGWGDKDMKVEDIEDVRIFNKIEEKTI